MIANDAKRKTQYNLEAKRASKKTKTETELVYKFPRLSLNDRHLQALQSSKTSREAWLHGETIVAYLESQKASAFIFEDFHTQMIFKDKRQVKLKVNFFSVAL